MHPGTAGTGGGVATPPNCSPLTKDSSPKKHILSNRRKSEKMLAFRHAYYNFILFQLPKDDTFSVWFY